LHDVLHDFAAIAGGRNVEEDKFVRAVEVVAIAELDWIPGVAQTDEVYALDHTALLDVEARDDPFGQHAFPKKLRTTRWPTAPDFSGWNCTAWMLPTWMAAVSEMPL